MPCATGKDEYHTFEVQKKLGELTGMRKAFVVEVNSMHNANMARQRSSL